MTSDPSDRRAFLGGLLSTATFAALARSAEAQDPASKPSSQPAQDDEPNGEPNVPPGIDVATIAAAARLAKLEFTESERAQIVKTIGDSMRVYGVVRDAHLENEEEPAEIFEPALPGAEIPTGRGGVRSAPLAASAPSTDEDLAFASIRALGAQLRARKVTSEQLTRLSLERLKTFGPKLECVITLTEERALEHARRADRELASGKDRGPLHGIPWGAKDLFDTAGIKTTWGAEPWAERVPKSDADVVKKLDDAGAVLVAKLTLGALAYGDIWFGGKTRNPWKISQGSSGSSAGSAAATAAGLVPFALGTETYGSIASPSARCGSTGYRPSFGLVSRGGAMALSWSLDKVGSIARSVEDCALAFSAIAGASPRDPASRTVPIDVDFAAPIAGMRVGFVKSAFESKRATDDDRKMIGVVEKLGAKLVAVEVAEATYDGVIFLLICVEGAAAFDDMTRSNRDDDLKWQALQAWPNTFRTTRFVPAVEYVQASRLRRRWMKMAASLFANVDAVIAPTSFDAFHPLTNLTGQPAVTIRQGFRPDGTPRGVTLWGKVYGDAAVLRLAHAFERELGVWQRRPKLT